MCNHLDTSPLFFSACLTKQKIISIVRAQKRKLCYRCSLPSAQQRGITSFHLLAMLWLMQLYMRLSFITRRLDWCTFSVVSARPYVTLSRAASQSVCLSVSQSVTVLCYCMGYSLPPSLLVPCPMQGFTFAFVHESSASPCLQSGKVLQNGSHTLGIPVSLSLQIRNIHRFPGCIGSSDLWWRCHRSILWNTAWNRDFELLNTIFLDQCPR